MSSAAQQLAEWIGATHPDFYTYLYSHVARQQAARALARSRLRGFADDDLYFTPDLPDTGGGDDLYFTPDTSDATSLEFTPDYSAVDSINASLDTAANPLDSFQPTLATVPISSAAPATNPSAPDTGTLDVATDNSGGLLSTVGSGIASAASSVGNFLTSAQGLSDVTKLATAYFGLQNTKANAQLQTAVLQAQVARASNGTAPAPVTYALNSAGQLVPIYAVTAGGTIPAALAAAIQNGTSQYVTTPSGVSGYTVPANTISALGSGVSLTSLLPWVLLIVGGLVLAKGLSE